MYTDNLIRKWNFEQQDMLDIREVLYQEALVKISNLEYELKMAKWQAEQANDSAENYKWMYENMQMKVGR